MADKVIGSSDLGDQEGSDTDFENFLDGILFPKFQSTVGLEGKTLIETMADPASLGRINSDGPYGLVIGVFRPFPRLVQSNHLGGEITLFQEERCRQNGFSHKEIASFCQILLFLRVAIRFINLSRFALTGHI